VNEYYEFEYLNMNTSYQGAFLLNGYKWIILNGAVPNHSKLVESTWINPQVKHVENLSMIFFMFIQVIFLSVKKRPTSNFWAVDYIL